MKNYVTLLLFCFLFSFCSQQKENKKTISEEEKTPIQLFESIPSTASGITFKNVTKQRIDFNFMNYMYVFVGEGVAVGDIDNDGFEDVYFVSNIGPNKLYRNIGDLKFEDITLTSKTEDYQGFSTGVSMLDINNDEWLDIYVCKAGSLKNNDARKNLLFVNQQDGTFKEDAKIWGLDDIAQILVQGVPHNIVVSNNAPLEVFTFQP